MTPGAEEQPLLWVLCKNDYPHSVYATEELADAQGREIGGDVRAQGQSGQFFHVHAVPFFGIA